MEHDFVFLNEKRINFKKLIKSFNKNQFINAVWFNYWENALTIDDYAPNDGTQKATYFGKEEKVKDVDLINTIRFSNRPCLYRTLSYKEWYEKYIKDFNTSKYVDVPFPENSHLGSNGVEETMIKVIREDVHTNDYVDIRYKWGLYLYGNIGDSPYVAHIDGSKNKFEGENKTIAEINGEEFLETYSWLL
jgi:hypothetical protein